MIITIIGLMFGDEGKGHTVAELTRKYKASLIVRFSGGSQAAHRVVVGNKSHIFAQFGSGSAVSDTVKTYLSDQMAVDPLNLIEEAKVHKNNGLGDLLSRLYISPYSPIITLYHKIRNRDRELKREKRISTTGLGVGEVHDDVRNDRLVIRALDLLHPHTLIDKITVLYESYKEEIDDLIKPNIVIEDLLYTSTLLDKCICDISIEDIGGTIIFEGSQGTLLDVDAGMSPYVTRCNVSLQEADKLISKHDCLSKDRFNIGIIRGYTTRHGIGPFPTESLFLTKLLPDKHNIFNEWQREFRVGWLDLSLLRYSLEYNKNINNIIVTNMDRLPHIVYCDSGCRSDIWYGEPKYLSYNKYNLTDTLETIYDIKVVAESWGEDGKWNWLLGNK